MYSLQEVMKEPMLLNSQSHDLHHRETVHQINNVPSIRSIITLPALQFSLLHMGVNSKGLWNQYFFPVFLPPLHCLVNYKRCWTFSHLFSYHFTAQSTIVHSCKTSKGCCNQEWMELAIDTFSTQLATLSNTVTYSLLQQSVHINTQY